MFNLFSRDRAAFALILISALSFAGSSLSAQTDPAPSAPAQTVLPSVPPPASDHGSAPNPLLDSSDDQAVTRLPNFIVKGRQDSLIGVADSATQGTIGSDELSDRPLLRTGEILETVPGLIITQHAGGGKANQYFTRGFNLDHGTDFATDLDGMPLNLPTHAHGQGYADLNGVIPELIDRIDFEKGPYYAANGDFSTVGAAHLVYADTLPADTLKVEGGTDRYARVL